MARSNTITKFLQDIVDDSKELVDDMIDRARDVEESAHDAVEHGMARRGLGERLWSDRTRGADGGSTPAMSWSTFSML